MSRLRVLLPLAAASAVGIACFSPSFASAAPPVAPTPRFQVDLVAVPDHFQRGSYAETFDKLEVVVVNVGGAKPTGPVGLELELEPSVTVQEGATPSDDELGTGMWGPSCSGVHTSHFKCSGVEFEPQESILRLPIAVGAGAGETVTARATVTGGAPEATGSLVIAVGGAAQPGISRFQAGPANPGGGPDTVAGDHPRSFLTLLTTPAASYVEEYGAPRHAAVRNSKDLLFDLPPGVVGDPLAAPQCPVAVFLSTPGRSPSECPAGSQVGEFSSSLLGQILLGSGEASSLGGRNPIFNLVPEAGYPAELGFAANGLSHGVVAPATLAHTSQGYVVRVVAPELITSLVGPYYLQASIFGDPEQLAGLPYASRAFLTNSSDCSGGSLSTSLHLDTYRDPAPVPLNALGTPDFAAANFSDPQWYSASSDAPPVTGCEELTFNPTVALKPTEAAADSPSGLAVKLTVPQNEDPEGRATPPLRDATVALPQGLVVDPSVASGLAGCDSAQLAPDSTDSGACPPGSKIGTATLHTPLIDHALEGSVFIGSPECAPCTDADAASGKLLKLYIEINDPQTGVVVKLPGSVTADPSTGQLTASFVENPQLPFEDLELNLKSGSRAPLTTPAACGEYTTTTDLEPWSAPQSGPDAKPQSRFELTSGAGGSACAGLTDSPGFEAGTTLPLAGTYSPFVLKVSRENGSQRIGSLAATLPAGLLGRIAGVPYCSDAAIAAAASKGGRAEQADPSCPLASEVGTVTVGAGSGTPFYVQGHVYLAGPYKGAPLSLEIITPAVAGPFDLGTVAVRTALYVNESTSQIHAVSDPIPSILAGVPLDVRSIALNMNKPEFTLNPTSCDAMAVLGQTTSTLGQTASLQSRFQVGGCKGLAFKPELKLAFTGATRRTGFPAVKAVLTQPKGQNANLAGAQVILPKGMLIANAHINDPCTRVQFASTAVPGAGCPAKSILGTAKVWTPLLEKPEEGKVYFRSNGGERKLPDLVVALRGQIPLQLVGFIDSVGKKGSEVRRVRTRFQDLPDAPVSRFELKLSGGKKGLLQNSKNLCKVSDKANFALTGQNGAIYDTEPKVQVACGKGRRKTAGQGKGGRSHGGKRR